MELYQIYRKNALRPWIIWAVVLAAAIVYLLAVWREDYSAILLLLALYLIPFGVSTFKLWTGIGAKGFRAYAEAHSEEDMRQLAAQYDGGRNFGHATLTDDHIIIMSRQDLDVIAYGELLWAYQVGRMSSLTGKHTYVTVVVTRDHRSRNVDIKGKEADLREYFAILREKNPGAIIGQDREVSRLYKKDFDGLCRLVDERTKEKERGQNPQTQETQPESAEPTAPAGQPEAELLPTTEENWKER